MLSGQEYVDEYASKFKKAKPAEKAADLTAAQASRQAEVSNKT